MTANRSSIIDLRGRVSDFVGSLGRLSILLLHHFTRCRHAFSVAAYKLPDDLNSCSRTTGLSSKHLARLVHDEHAARCSLGRLLQADGRDECLRRIAQQCVREVLLRLEGGVCFGAVVGEAVDAVAGCGQGLVRVAEEADLCGACIAMSAEENRVIGSQRTTRG